MRIEIEQPPKEAIIVMRRTFDAPRDVVWKALTTAEHVKQWYGGHGFANPVCEMDVRPGGRWKHVMRTPDGSEHPAEYVFLEVVKPEKLVWQSAGPDFGPAPGPHRNTMTVTLEEAGPRTTRWKLVTKFESLADREEAAKIGFTTVLSEGTEKFNTLVKQLARSAR